MDLTNCSIFCFFLFCFIIGVRGCVSVLNPAFTAAAIPYTLCLKKVHRFIFVITLSNVDQF